MTSLRHSMSILQWHDGVIKRKHFPRYWPFVREFTGNSPVPAQRPVTRSLMFSLICVWINGWVNNRGTGDLRRYRAFYDVTVMTQDLRRHSYNTATKVFQKFASYRSDFAVMSLCILLHCADVKCCKCIMSYVHQHQIYGLDWKHWTFNSEGTIMKPTHWWRSTVAFLNNEFVPFDLCYARY